MRLHRRFFVPLIPAILVRQKTTPFKRKPND